MAYDEILAERVTNILKKKRIPFEDKEMMGGFAVMIDKKMCVGINKNQLMARIDPEFYEEALKKDGCHEMTFTGRPMKGFVFIDTGSISTEKDLDYWVQLCLDFNPKAKSSKKR